MPRRYRPAKRIPLPDPVFNDVEVAKFINRMMQRGKKSTAQRLFLEALEMLEGKTPDKPLEVFQKAIEKARPMVRVKSRRVGGSTYQVPMEVDEAAGRGIAHRWLILYARSRKGRRFSQRLAGELLDAYNGTGATLKKREETHRMAEANKAFAHYRF